MGRYSTELAPKLVSFAGIERGMRVLDVGCGPGALTAALADRSGADNIAAVDPSEPLLAACAERIPGVDARVAHAERLPWPDGSFDAVASQLVLNFMKDPEAGVREMHRSPGRRASSPRAHGTTPTACSSFASSGTRLSSSIRQRRTRAG
jgi:ubiquinone/menaquinone biosynthesis C-methylase UbiE